MTDFSIILQRHTAVTQCKNQTLSRACYFIEYKDFSDVREVRRLLKTWSKVVIITFRFSSSQVSRVESELLETKQRPFRLMSLAGIENWVSILDSILYARFSRGSRIECQLTFERYCTWIERLFPTPPLIPRQSPPPPPLQENIF